MPLKLYYSGTRQDNFTTATSEGIRSAEAAGYGYIRIEGYLFNAALFDDNVPNPVDSL
jgi:hypothetical protein